MPSNNKRKHHGVPLHISNGELPVASSPENRTDVSPSAEIFHRKHTVNGKENLSVIETQPLARPSSNGVPAENSCHGQTLARTSDGGVPAESSCSGGNVDATEKSMNGSLRSAYQSGYGGIQNGEAMSSQGKTAHGNLEHLCYSPECVQSGLLHQPKGDAEAISNLKQLNKQLLQQVCSLRSHDSVLQDQLKALQAQLLENTVRGEALFAERTWIEHQKVKFESELKESNENAAKLGLEKWCLLEEKQALIASSNGLERDLADCKEEVRQAGEKLKDSADALAMAEERVQGLKAEIEALHLDQLKLNGEINLLQMQNSDVQCAMRDLQMEKGSLDKELRSMQDTCATMERQVAEANQVKEALKAKLASSFLQREGFQMQLEGAWQQIRSLESQQEASKAEKIDLEKQIQQVVNELSGTRREQEETRSMLKLERTEKASLEGLLKNTEEISKGLEVELYTMSSSMEKLQVGASKSQKQIKFLEAQVASLAKEKAMLEESKGSLKEELEHLKFSSEEASASSKDELSLLKKEVRKLEEALALVGTQVFNEGKCVSDLNSVVRELYTSLKKTRGLMEVSIPIAAVSLGTLVSIGTMYLWKRES